MTASEDEHVHEHDVGGTLIDYSRGVPRPSAIADAGYLGAIRYVADPRAAWMAGKPILADEARALVDAGLAVVSVYQYGKTDWDGGYEAGVRHAERGVELHRAAGGPDDAPIYVAIDANPTFEQFETLIAPYLQGWHEVVGKEHTGVYANAPTIDWVLDAGLGSWFWMHDWGSDGRVHEAAHLHQFEIDTLFVDGIGIDRNRILKPDYGRW